MKQCIVGSLVVLLVVLVLSGLGGEVLSQESATYVVTSTQNINGRACARLDCAVLTSFEPGSTVEVIESVEGESVLGSTTWYQVEFEGQAVHIHSSLVARETTVSTTEVAVIDTSDWVGHQGSGFSIMAPSEWVDFTGDQSFINFSVESAMAAQGDECARCEDNWRSLLENSIFATHPHLLGASVMVTPAYVGIDLDLQELQLFINGATFADDETLVSNEIVELPEGLVLRSHMRQGDDPSYGLVWYTYTLYRGGIEFSIQIYGPLAVEELEPSFDAIASSLTIDDIGAVHAALTLDAGTAGVGDNSGELLAGKRQIWTYDAVAGDVLTISASAGIGYPTGPDTLLTIYAPDGTVVATNDDSGFLGWNLNARIDDLEFVESGLYTIEVAATSYDYVDGRYTLRLEGKSVQTAPGLALATTSEVVAEAAAESDGTPESPVAHIDQDNTVLRSGPGVTYPRVGTAGSGNLLAVLGRSGEGQSRWYQVELPDGTVGWASSRVATLLSDGAKHRNVKPPPAP